MPRSIRRIASPSSQASGKSGRQLYDEARGSACARGYGRRHERWRLLILNRDPLCQIEKCCGKGVGRPIPAPATHADHIIPLRSRWDRLTPEQRDRVRRFFDEDLTVAMQLDPEEALRRYVWAEENGQGVCKPCHDWKTRQEQKRA